MQAADTELNQMPLFISSNESWQPLYIVNMNEISASHLHFWITGRYWLEESTEKECQFQNR